MYRYGTVNVIKGKYLVVELQNKLRFLTVHVSKSLLHPQVRLQIMLFSATLAQELASMGCYKIVILNYIYFNFLMLAFLSDVTKPL